MDKPQRTLASSRARGPYASQACTVCRSKKSKCDGVKPVCSSCAASGRHQECSWGRDTSARKPRTEAHFEALQKRADALQTYADGLEKILANCVCQDVNSHLQSKPTVEDKPAVQEESDTDWNDSDESITQELTVPLQRLKLDGKFGGQLLHNGITTPLRYTPSDELPPVKLSAPNLPTQSYVLLVDRVNEKNAHPEIDWSRYLPPEVSLDRREHDKIIDLSFKFWTGWCHRLAPSLFFRDMYRALSVPRGQPPPRTPWYSPMLHNSMLAICSIFSDDPYIRDPGTRVRFADFAKSYLEKECQKPEVSLIHALAFLGTFYANLGDRIMGDLYAGMSSRMCMSLGVGSDSAEWVSSGLITHDEMVGRNWAHWTIFCVEVCWALFFGRDFSGPPSDGRRQVTMPVVDPEADQAPWFHAPSGIPPQPNLWTLTFHQASALFVIDRKIIDVVNGLERAQDVVRIDQLVTRIDLELNNWKSQLPAELDITLANKNKSTPHRLMLHCEYWWSFVVLHRPFFSRKASPIQQSDREIDHVKLCKRAAENILDLTEVWSNLYTLRYTNVTMLQVLYGAGTIFVLLALQATASARIAHTQLQTALTQAEQCIFYLRDMGQTWATALQTGDALGKILHDKAYPIISRRLAHKGVRLSALMPNPSPVNQPLRPQQDNVVSEPRIADWTTTSGFYYPQRPMQPIPVATAFLQDLPDVDIEAFMPNFELGAGPTLWYNQNM
ncbi:Zn(2)-C6 fungal-type domain-containing protein [Mycena indigotica]|uniref:Zn(2)-C6 fungal-type domain-containing protein n=1 Tax=Mycena indigotica TaxID=2126181 RepID=A0A8H6S6A6_9AGAR|nr:Zn(2)-C6 fungal-type domain-containing protein [Mycena indigotica]KAF7293010.1 Zn(2)-C6 fungal-type domain-containing protein [Mycena indigotica]